MSRFDADVKLLKMDSQEWQLFSSMSGAGLAAHNLTEATRKALAEMQNHIAAGDGVMTAAKKAYAHVFRV
jgi:hypothetical protein